MSLLLCLESIHKYIFKVYKYITNKTCENSVNITDSGDKVTEIRYRSVIVATTKNIHVN